VEVKRYVALIPLLPILLFLYSHASSLFFTLFSSPDHDTDEEDEDTDDDTDDRAVVLVFVKGTFGGGRRRKESNNLVIEIDAATGEVEAVGSTPSGASFTAQTEPLDKLIP
jgi:hypothetical protein